jgi:hypothetical protein
MGDEMGCQIEMLRFALIVFYEWATGDLAVIIFLDLTQA